MRCGPGECAVGLRLPRRLIAPKLSDTRAERLLEVAEPTRNACQAAGTLGTAHIVLQWLWYCTRMQGGLCVHQHSTGPQNGGQVRGPAQLSMSYSRIKGCSKPTLLLTCAGTALLHAAAPIWTA